MRKENAKARTDGRATRQALIDAAGILAARHGWASVCAKDVCRLAGVSAASVNYWFGGRDALYAEVIRQIPEGLIDAELEAFLAGDADPLERIRRVLERFILTPRGRSQWHLTLWAREVFMGPSEEFMRLMRTRGTKRVILVRRVLAEYLGICAEGPEIEAVVMTMLAPCLMATATAPEVLREIYPSTSSGRGRQVLVEHILEMLRIFKEARARGKAAA